LRLRPKTKTQRQYQLRTGTSQAIVAKPAPYFYLKLNSIYKVLFEVILVCVAGFFNDLLMPHNIQRSTELQDYTAQCIQSRMARNNNSPRQPVEPFQMPNHLSEQDRINLER
jgi:hypothetical protein